MMGHQPPIRCVCLMILNAVFDESDKQAEEIEEQSGAAVGGRSDGRAASSGTRLAW